jgi:hypothetical protein
MSTKTFTEGVIDGRNNSKMTSSDPDYIKGYEAGKKEYFKDQDKEEELRNKRRQNGTLPNKVKIAFGFDGIKVHKEEDLEGNGGLEITPTASFATFRKVILIFIILIFIATAISFTFSFIRAQSMFKR